MSFNSYVIAKIIPPNGAVITFSHEVEGKWIVYLRKVYYHTDINILNKEAMKIAPVDSGKIYMITTNNIKE